MKIKRHFKLWLYFASIIFFILLVTAITVSSIAYVLLYFDLIQIEDKSSWVHGPLILLILISIVVSTFISFYLAVKILNPVTKFSEVSHQVAKGNFDIQLEEISSIDEIRDLVNNFNFMIKELSSIETLRNDFVASVSHEFKTPIAAIEGYATLIQDKTLSAAEHDDYTQMIIESSHQLSTLCGNILTLTKLENQEVQLTQTSFRLDELIRQSILLLENEWGPKEIEFHLELPPVTFTGNDKFLFLVWKNIIENAIKFTSFGGNITIQLLPAPSDVTVTISDDGCGMSPAVLKHAFDKFYQGDSTHKSTGNGLGLSLTKKIIDLCGGEISVSSTENVGTTFSVSLPVPQID